MRWTPNGRHLVVWGKRVAQIWHADTSTRLTVPLLFEQDIAETAISADGRSLLVATEEGRVWRERFDTPDWPDEDWQFLVRAISSQEIDKTESAVPWRGLRADSTVADAEALNARWQQLRPRLRELQAH